MYVEQLYAVLRNRYTSIINSNRLRQHNLPIHTSIVVHETLTELEAIEGLPQPTYSPDLAPSDYHPF